MTNHISLAIDRLSANSSVVSPPLETPASSASQQVPTNIPVFCSDENPQSIRIQHESCIGTSERIGRHTMQEISENQADVAECRICQEEDKPCNLEIPCSCRGSMKFAHHGCVQRWCNEKGDAICEICNQPYKHGYIVPTRSASNGIPVEFRGEWGVAGAPHSDFHVLAIAAAEEYGELTAVNASAAACCRSAALLLVAVLLVRHAFAMASVRGDEDASTIFALFLLKAAGFLLPCYIMARIMHILHQRRQRQDVTLGTAAVAVFFRGVQN